MRLHRYCYADDHTAGKLFVGDRVLRAIERPWIAALSPGGMPHTSCIPDGTYELLRHARPSGDVCVALRNPALGVYYSTEHVPAAGGRYLILIHVANYVQELHGCIAPGLGATIRDDRHMVTASRFAMRLIMQAFEAGDRTLEITPECGTRP